MTHANAAPTELELSREESWVAHAAVLVALDRALEDGDGPRAHRTSGLLAALEADGDDYDPAELSTLARALDEYLANDPPARDRLPARDALRRVDAALLTES